MRALQPIASYDQSISLYSCTILLQKLGKRKLSQYQKNLKDSQPQAYLSGILFKQICFRNIIIFLNAL